MAADTPVHIGGTVTGRAVFPHPPGAGPQLPKARDHMAYLFPRQQGKYLAMDLAQESVVTKEMARKLAQRFDKQLMMQAMPVSNAMSVTVNPSVVDYADIEARVLAFMKYYPDHVRGPLFSDVYGAKPMSPTAKRGLNGPLDIPLAWKSALREVQKLFPTAVLAGGALRDRDYGVKVKDLDIFIESKTPSLGSVTEAQGLLKLEGIESTLIDTTQYAEWFGDKTVVGILETKFEGAPLVSLIFVTIKTDETLLANFDFGLSQIMWDGQYLKKTGAYDTDFRMKRFRIVTACNHRQLIRRMERWARLKEKYPNHKLDFGVMSPDGNIGGIADPVVRIAHGV